MDRQEEAGTLQRKGDIDDGSIKISEEGKRVDVAVDDLPKSGEEGNATTLSLTTPGLENKVDSLFDAVQRIQQSVMTLLTKDKVEQKESGKAARKTSPHELLEIESEPEQLNQGEDEEPSVPVLDALPGELHQGEHKEPNKTTKADEGSRSEGFTEFLRELQLSKRITPTF